MTLGSGISISQQEQSQEAQNIALRQLMEGRSNAVGTFTIAHDGSATSTPVTAVTCGPNSGVWLSPATAHAVAALGTTYPSSISPGKFVVTHQATTASDITFNYVCLG